MQKTAIGGLFLHAVSSDRNVNWLPPQMMRVMRLLTFYFFAACLSASASGTAQSITLFGKDLTIKEVFTAIERQTGYVVGYNPELFPANKTISLSSNKLPLEDFLDMVLKDQHLEYDIQGKTIFISRKSMSLLSDQSTRNIDQPAAHSPINGRITDVDGNPISGISVMIKGKRTGTTTDANGNFSINVKPGQTVVISSVEYETKEIKVGEETSFNITLTRSFSSLNEIVVNKGYYSESKRLSTGNVSKVSAKEIEQQPVINVISALQGRVPGLDITESGGMVGTGIKVRIRGTNSIAGGNDPLYIIDGIPYGSESLGSLQVSRQLPAGAGGINPLNTLNAADIESIEILKDADATAIYGSRGANGVILITTKKGKAGKTKVDFSMDGGVNRPTRFLELLNTQEYLKMRRAAFEEDGIDVVPGNAYDINGTWDTTRYTSWHKELTGRPAARLSTQLSLSGGSELTQFLISGSFLRQVPSFPKGYNFHYQKASVHFNLSHRSENKKLFTSFTANYSTDFNNAPGSDLTASFRSLAPTAPKLYEEDGSLHWETGFDNPLAVLNASYEGVTKSLNANLNIGYQLAKDLEIKSSFGFNDYGLDEYYTNPNTVNNPLYEIGPDASYAFGNIGSRNSWIIEPQLTWKKNIGRGVLDILIGTTIQQSTSKRKEESGENFPSNSLIYNMKSAVFYSLRNTSQTLYKYNALFGRFNYNLDGKYIINLTGRRDGSSRFGPGSQFANFGAVGIAWIFSEEKFLGNQSIVSFGKLRASYGVTGNDQIGDYEFLNTYGPNGKYGNMTGMIPLRHYNPDFSWEENKKLELAMDLGFLKNNLMISISYYQNRSDNQLVGLPLSGITGFTMVRTNLDAMVENKGLEIEINSKNIHTNNFTWETSFNYSLPRNKLISYPGLASSSHANTYVIGQPLTIKKLYHYLGIDPTKGIYTFEDFNKDGLLTSADDRKIVCFEGINYTAAVGNTFSYKSFQLDVFFQYVNKTGRNFLYSNGGTGGFGSYNVSRSLLNNWTYNKENPTYQRLTTGMNNDAVTANGNLNFSDASISDASFLRLKNINLGYEISKKWLGMTGRVYIQGQNLLTLSRYLGSDPESANESSMPPLKVWNFGMQFIF